MLETRLFLQAHTMLETRPVFSRQSATMDILTKRAQASAFQHDYKKWEFTPYSIFAMRLQKKYVRSSAL